ncbi:MAG: FUSC family protein [Variovorax sp.]
MKEGWLQDADHRHGLQMALAVLLAYGASLALRLPEGIWAVMSALIVMRPNTGATMGAGWDRVRGTAIGTLCGLFGVWLQHEGASLPAATLFIVAVLAFVSGLVPALRSGPITALIVVSSGGVAGHSAFAIAGLRAVEIAIGIGAGLAVTGLAPSARAAPRFDALCAALLRQLAGECRQALLPNERPAPETAAASLRIALRRLTLLAMDVEREARLPWRRAIGQGATPSRCRQRSALVGRIAQQVGALGRLFRALPAAQLDPLWNDLRNAAGHALDSTADAIAGAAPAQLAPLQALGTALRQRLQAADGYDEPAALLAGPVRLLTDDLLLLRRLQAPRPVTSALTT